MIKYSLLHVEYMYLLRCFRSNLQVPENKQMGRMDTMAPQVPEVSVNSSITSTNNDKHTTERETRGITEEDQGKEEEDDTPMRVEQRHANTRAKNQNRKRAIYGIFRQGCFQQNGVRKRPTPEKLEVFQKMCDAEVEVILHYSNIYSR